MWVLGNGRITPLSPDGVETREARKRQGILGDLSFFSREKTGPETGLIKQEPGLNYWIRIPRTFSPRGCGGNGTMKRKKSLILVIWSLPTSDAWGSGELCEVFGSHRCKMGVCAHMYCVVSSFRIIYWFPQLIFVYVLSSPETLSVWIAKCTWGFLLGPEHLDLSGFGFRHSGLSISEPIITMEEWPQSPVVSH